MIFAPLMLLCSASYGQDELKPSKNITEKLPKKLIGHGGPIRAIEISQNGKQALTGSFDYAINLWGLEGAEGKIIHRLIGHNAAVNDVAFISDDRAVSVGDDGAFIVWNLKTAKPIKTFVKLNDKILDVAVSANQAYAATARWDGAVHLYDLNTLELVQEFKGHRGNVNAVVFSPNGSSLYSASYDGTIRQWSLNEKADPRLMVKHGWGINVITALGDDIIYGALDGSVVRLKTNADEKLKEIIKLKRPILSLVISPDQSLYAVGSGDGYIRIFDAVQDKLLEEYQASFGPVWAMDFLPDSHRLYHAGLDDFAILWQLNPRAPYEPVKSELPRRFQVSEGAGIGEIQFKRKCSVCHTLKKGDGNRAGPSLYNIFGRRAGSLPNYPYSDALLNSDIIWNEQSISRLFDEGPDVVTPGTKMPIQRLKSVEKRDELINYLKQATAPAH